MLLFNLIPISDILLTALVVQVALLSRQLANYNR